MLSLPQRCVNRAYKMVCLLYCKHALRFALGKNILTLIKFRRYYRTSKKSNLDISKELDEILIGLMLGDLHAEKRGVASNTRLQFKQSETHKDYLYPAHAGEIYFLNFQGRNLN